VARLNTGTVKEILYKTQAKPVRVFSEFSNVSCLNYANIRFVT